jgi:hypothetical protein
MAFFYRLIICSIQKPGAKKKLHEYQPGINTIHPADGTGAGSLLAKFSIQFV